MISTVLFQITEINQPDHDHTYTIQGLPEITKRKFINTNKLTKRK